MTNSHAAHAGKDKIHEALALLSEAAKDKKSELQELLSSEFEDLREVLASAEEKLVEHEHELVDRGRERVVDMATSLDKKVHEDPWAALGWVSVGAVLLGYFLGRSK